MVRRQFPGLRERQDAKARAGFHHPASREVQEADAVGSPRLVSRNRRLSRRVADRRVILLAIAGDQICLVRAVDDAARIDPVIGAGAEIIGKFLARKYPPRHPDEKNLGGDIEIERLLGGMHEVDAKQVAHPLVVLAPRQLHKAAAIVSFSGFRIDLSVFLAPAFSLLLAAAEATIGSTVPVPLRLT